MSALIGVLVVALFHGVQPRDHDSSVADAVRVTAGLAALAFAIAVGTGRVVPGQRRTPDDSSSRLARLRRRPTLHVAAVAGVVTHVPGLFYLVALSGIADGQPRFVHAVAEVLVYNAIWFSVPIAAVLLAGRRPEELRARVDGATEFTRRNRRALLSAAFAVAGAYLTVNGVTGLLA